MISCTVLESPGRWRSITAAIVLAAGFAPGLPLLWEALSEPSSQSSLDGVFLAASLRSLTVAFAVAVASLCVGVPTGVLAGLYEFPGRRPLLALLAVPLIVPSFLWAIGLSQFRIQIGLQSESILSGFTGTVLAFMCSAVPLVIYMTFVSSQRLAKGQIEAARLFGGEKLVFRCATQALLPSATLAATLGGILTLADPGPGQILGYQGAAYEILVSFSAFYDFALAARQCALLTGLVLLLSIPVAVFVAPSVAAGILGRDVAPAEPVRDRICGGTALLLLAIIVTCAVILPLIGIIRPLLSAFPAQRAFQEVSRTILNTFYYAFIAGVLATILGTILAIAVGRQRQLRASAVVGLFVILSLPPSLSALGIIKVGTLAPAWLDPLLRGKFTVGLASALKFFPVAGVLAMRSFGITSPSQCLAAAIHGISLSRYLFRVLGPAMLASAGMGCIIVALVATAEVATPLLLRPPGADSVPVQIFTIMANAPETLVGALCFMYIAGAALLLVLGWTMTLRFRHDGRRV
jgi:iron(III) transport system permease protein